RDRQQFEKWENFSRKALPTAEARYGASSEEVSQIWRSIFESCRKQKKYTECITAAQCSLAIHEKLEPNGLAVSNDLAALAHVYSDAALYPQGERCALQSLAMKRKICKPNDRSIIDTMQVLAVIYGQEHKLESALPLFKHIQKMAPSVYGPNSWARCV